MNKKSLGELFGYTFVSAIVGGAAGAIAGPEGIDTVLNAFGMKHNADFLNAYAQSQNAVEWFNYRIGAPMGAGIAAAGGLGAVLYGAKELAKKTYNLAR